MNAPERTVLQRKPPTPISADPILREVNTYVEKVANFGAFAFTACHTPDYNAALLACDTSWELIAEKTLALRGIETRLDDLMRKCREDHHEICYADLLAVKGSQ